ncbi:hypothetical protein AB1283_25930 [Bacillus sp. S13(2024)]|uniref:hypothetical protein n=1 Tax=Bacillus sp. S13(2024) TaxID=3162885 RepID=UPI003D2441FC
MKQIGRKIFYEILTGNVIIDTGERQGSVIETTVEQDIKSFSVLSERNRDTFDVIQLKYGAYSQDFVSCNGYRVNPETKRIEFSYPDPNKPETQPIYQKPLSEEIAETKQALAELTLLIAGGM